MWVLLDDALNMRAHTHRVSRTN